jgi:hypothetical protein
MLLSGIATAFMQRARRVTIATRRFVSRRILAPATLMLCTLGWGTAAHAWTEYVIYSPALGSGENVVSVALAPSTDFSPLLGDAYYLAFEVSNGATQSLYLQKWYASSFLASPILLNGALNGLHNPSVTTRPGHVTISAHYPITSCAGVVLGLKEYDYDVVTGTIDASRVIDAGGGTCSSAGHSHIIWSPLESLYHVCWTRKEGGVTGDEVYCATRAPGAAAWSPAESISLGATNAQDHATVAINAAGANGRRVAYHDATTGMGNDANEAVLAMFKPAGDRTDFLLPNGTPTPQSGWQDRPFIAVDSTGKMHAAWEDGPNNNEVIKYARCINTTPKGCDTDAEWEFNNVAISEPGINWAHTPHLITTFARTWISYEQALIGGAVAKDVVVLHRCLSAPFTQAWTLTDPYPADDRNEFTEEYGTPHIASRKLGQLSSTPIEIGTVTLRQNPVTTLYEGILYTLPEPPCP